MIVDYLLPNLDRIYLVDVIKQVKSKGALATCEKSFYHIHKLGVGSQDRAHWVNQKKLVILRELVDLFSH